MSRVLRENNVRMVNLSTGAEVDAVAVPWLTKFKFARELLRIEHRAQQRFIRRHPEILFFFAAGNASRVLEEKHTDIVLNAGQPNVLVVGNIGIDATPTRSTNRSPDYVDVMANGRWRESGGTSYSAPLAMNTVAVDLLANPDLTIAEARDRFLTRACFRSAELESASVRGTYLPSGLKLSDCPVLPFLVMGRPNAETFRQSLDHPTAGGALELTIEFFETWRAIFEKSGRDMLYLQLMGALIEEDQAWKAATGDLSRQPVPTRERLRQWMARRHARALILPYTLDGRAFRGLTVQGDSVTPLDHVSAQLAPLVEEIRCEINLTRASG